MAGSESHLRRGWHSGDGVAGVGVAVRTAEAARQRLESSDLYQRREREAKRSHDEAKLHALWYGDEKFVPRYKQPTQEAQR